MSNDRASTLWPGRPAPLPGETFSSWFSRLARCNALEPASLYRVALSGAYLHRRDLDRFACDQLIANLASHTGFDERSLFRLMLARWQGYVFEIDDGQCKLPWLPPAGNEESRRSFGQQVCPKCLAEDEIPYLRSVWRLSFVTECPQHRVLLIDRCPNCSEPAQILHSPTDPSGAIRCWKCVSDLSKAKTLPITSPSDLQIQKELLEIAGAGWALLGAYGPVYSLAYFRILMIVFRLLATGRYALPLRNHLVATMGDEQPPPANIPRIKEVELLNPRCRQTLIRTSHWLMQEWPHRFVEACKAVGLSRRRLIKDRNVPFAYWDAVTRYLCRPPRHVSAAELTAAKQFLKTRGRKPTYRALTELLGHKFFAHHKTAEPAANIRAYGTHRYWKLDGVSPEVRKAAKLAAKREGENVGPWVDKILRETLLRTIEEHNK
jgi:hypothetical protein